MKVATTTTTISRFLFCIQTVIAFSVLDSSSSSSSSSSISSQLPAHQQQQQQQKQRPTMNVIIIGGSSGMGKAVALETLQNGGKVMIVSRNSDKLHHAKLQLLEQIKYDNTSLYNKDDDNNDDNNKDNEDHDLITTRVLDATDEMAVQNFARSLDDDDDDDNSNDTTWDGLVVSCADKAKHGPMMSIPTSDAKYMMETKFWSAYYCAKYIAPKLCRRRDVDESSSVAAGSGPAVVFVSGVLNRRPGINCVPLAISNGAIEGLTRSLALEWGTQYNIRVNCLSPGFCETERFDHMDVERKQQMLQNTAASLPLQKVGQPSDMGKAIYYLLTAPYVTGIVLDVDGGHMIRQYANPINDPMRNKN